MSFSMPTVYKKAPFASKRMVGPVGAAAATGAVEEKEKRDGCEGRPASLSKGLIIHSASSAGSGAGEDSW